MVLSFIFTIFQWYKFEDTWEKRLKTLPVLLLQIYPQYRGLRILYLWMKNDESWFEEKQRYITEVATIGKYKG